MWEEIIQTCENFWDHKKPSNNVMKIGDVTQLTLELDHCYEQHRVEHRQEIPFGRYLLYHDPREKFHIEMHIFSKGYKGAIHCHNTWGIFWLISGRLFVEDYKIDKQNVQIIRSGLLSKRGALNFCPPFSDWHRVSTPILEEQTLSIHIYGKGYDLERGQYLNENNTLEEAQRSSFKDNKLFLPFIHSK